MVLIMISDIGEFAFEPILLIDNFLLNISDRANAFTNRKGFEVGITYSLTS
jgi:hypothetical protein